MFYRCLSVHGGGGGAWSRGEGVCVVLGGGIPACTEADPPPPGETATAPDGTHPTGMHSCSEYVFGMNEELLLILANFRLRCNKRL